MPEEGRIERELGLVPTATGGPGLPHLWLDEEIPVDASVNINWYIEQARLAEEARFDLVFIVDSQFTPAAGLTRPDLRRPVRLERGHQRRCRDGGQLLP